MKVGKNGNGTLKDISNRTGIPFANVLKGYVMECAIGRLIQSDFAENLWFMQQPLTGIHNYEKNRDPKLDIYYIESEKYISPDKMVCGQRLSQKLLETMMENMYAKPIQNGVKWEWEITPKPIGYQIELIGIYEDMNVPIRVRLQALSKPSIRPETIQIPLLIDENKTISFKVYSSEYILGESFFEIMKKLELIGDMASYWEVYQILQQCPVSGRHVLEIMEDYIQTEPQTGNPKRMDCVEGYMNYSYMRKRWEKYVKNNKDVDQSWQQVLETFLKFAKPIWNAICSNEVFLGDWMPELQRFLG